MKLSFWAKTHGTWLNIVTVLIGGLFGLLLRGRLPEPMQAIIIQGVGLVTVFVGISMASSLEKGSAKGRLLIIDGVVLGLLTLVIGGLLGVWWGVEEGLNYAGNWLKAQFSGGGLFTEGFVTASLLFCVGPMTLLGSLNNGLTGDTKLLVLKSTLDGLAAIALTSSFGVGVMFSIVIILVYQGGVSLAAASVSSHIPDPTTNPKVLLITGVGGLLIVGLGINLLEIQKIRVAALLPALILAPIMHWLAMLVIRKPLPTPIASVAVGEAETTLEAQ